MRQELERRKAAFTRDEDPLDELPIAVLILVGGELVRANDGWTSLTGLESRNSIGDQWLRGIHEEDRADALQLTALDSGNRIRIGELRVRSADPDVGEVWVHARTRVIGADDPTACVVTLTEIDARKSHELRLLHLATHDAATGLVNREHFLAKLESEIARGDDGPPLALLFVDLDRFKEVNDLHGHAFGDLVLAAIAERLKASVRPSDTVARLGGDEFAILLPGIERPADAAHLADRAVAALTAPLVFGDRAVSVGASIGIAISSPDRSARALLELADQAMYRSKSTGGSRWTFAELTQPSWHQEVEARSGTLAEDVSKGSPIEELLHDCHVTLTTTETEVLTVVGRLGAGLGAEFADAARAAEVVRSLFDQLWTVLADASIADSNAG